MSGTCLPSNYRCIRFFLKSERREWGHCLSFYVLKGGEPDRDKIKEMAIYSTATTTTTHMDTAVYSVLYEGMCPTITLALKNYLVLDTRTQPNRKRSPNEMTQRDQIRSSLAAISNVQNANSWYQQACCKIVEVLDPKLRVGSMSNTITFCQIDIVLNRTGSFLNHRLV